MWEDNWHFSGSILLDFNRVLHIIIVCHSWHHDVVWRHDIRWHHRMSYDVMWRHMTSHHKPSGCTLKSYPYAPKSQFLTLWPWPLTYDLAHRTWPRYGPGRPLCKISYPYVTRFNCESAHRRTDTHTAPILVIIPIFSKQKTVLKQLF